MSAEKFLKSISYVPPTIAEMKSNWETFSQGFNDISAKGEFSYKLDVSVYDEELLLTIVDMQRSCGDGLAVQSRFGIRYRPDDFAYTLTCELEPGAQDCYDIPATPDDVAKLRRRCLAEILVAVGVEQGTAFRRAVEQNPPDGNQPSMLH